MKLKLLSIKTGIDEELLVQQWLDAALTPGLTDVIKLGKSKGYTVKQLCAELCVTKDTLYKWQRGDVKTCGRDVRYLLKEMLGVVA